MNNEQIPVNPEIIRWARERAGFTHEEALDTFKKFPQWEDGEAYPTYPQLEQLSNKFKVPIALFFFPNPPELPSIEETFRTLDLDIMDQLPSKIRLLLRKAKAFQIGLEELNGGINPAERLITKDLSFKTTASLGSIAIHVRKYLGITMEQQFSWRDEKAALENWRQALMRAGIYVFKDQFRIEGYSGFCLYDEVFPIIYVNNTTSKTRQIFTLFHELAHLLFHTSGIDTINDDHIDTLPRNDQRIEIICNRFAAHFLVPEKIFERAFANREASEETASELANLFNVSREFVYRKFLDRDLISEDKYKHAAKKWANQRKKGSGGNPYNTKIAYLGPEYINLAFTRYYQNQIDEGQLADYLDSKPKHLDMLEDIISRRVP